MGAIAQGLMLSDSAVTDLDDCFVVFSQYTTIQGRGKLEGQFDFLFRDEYPAMLAWLVAHLEAHFGSFLDSTKQKALAPLMTKMGQGGSFSGF